MRQTLWPRSASAAGAPAPAGARAAFDALVVNPGVADDTIARLAERAGPDEVDRMLGLG